jgi:RNA polymerase sigma-70 factor (ECF subfamily)
MPAPAIAAAERDEDLMLAYAAGDAAAFETLYSRHKGGVYRYVLRQCANAGIAEELFQDVWMNVLRARASYVPTAKFTTWLYRIAYNRLIDHWRTTGQVELVTGRTRRRGRGSAGVDSGRRVTTSPMCGRSPASAPSDCEPPAPRCRRCSAKRSCCIRKAASSSPRSPSSLAPGVETVKSRIRYAVAKLRLELEDLR